MHLMFACTNAFNQPLNDWDLSRVATTRFMFYGARVFNQPLDRWNLAAATAISYMFCSASAFNQPLVSWNVASIPHKQSMFYDAVGFHQPETMAVWRAAGSVTCSSAWVESAHRSPSPMSCTVRWGRNASVRLPSQCQPIYRTVSPWTARGPSVCPSVSSFHPPLPHRGTVRQGTGGVPVSVTGSRCLSRWALRSLARSPHSNGMCYEASLCDQPLTTWVLRPDTDMQ
eukprot:gene18490-21606_t